MNAYDIVNKLMGEGKRHILERELTKMCGEESPIVEAILKNKYNGRYVWDGVPMHQGEWWWDNPLLTKTLKGTLYRIPYGEDNLRQGLEAVICGCSEYACIKEEVCRMEPNLNKESKEDVEKVGKILETYGCYKGENYFWIYYHELRY